MTMSNLRSGNVAAEIAMARAVWSNQSLNPQELQRSMRMSRDFIVHHELKIYPKFFIAAAEGKKKAEVRKRDRDFRVGDILWMREFEPIESKYSGRAIECRVTHIIDGGAFGIDADYCVLSFEVVAEERFA